jgi:hypothetical protein
MTIVIRPSEKMPHNATFCLFRSFRQLIIKNGRINTTTRLDNWRAEADVVHLRRRSVDQFNAQFIASALYVFHNEYS